MSGETAIEERPGAVGMRREAAERALVALLGEGSP